MSRIRQLSTSVINKIAAGEVIERPASVVKELLENSVDALATRIDVEILAGGSELIRIVDDGEGIHPDDLLLAVSSHATSKICDADDLFGVQTMGFRGEALASVAEVSRLRIRSRQEGQPNGYELSVNLGEVVEPRPCGCPHGTQIEIRNLFENTPVRRKFLKTMSTEFGHISEQFTRVAIANPRLHMVLRHNDKLVVELPASDRPLDRLQLFFGNEIASELIAVESDQAGVRIWGYVGHPDLSKATRKQQYLFLNGRWITDRSLQHALTEAYRGLLMIGRQPVAFLFIELPPDRVDVNVHPTKVEVRFQDSQQLFRQLLSMIRSKFLSLDLKSQLRIPSSGFVPGNGTLTGFAPPPSGQGQQRMLPEGVGFGSVNAINSPGWNSGGGTSLLSPARSIDSFGSIGSYVDSGIHNGIGHGVSADCSNAPGGNTALATTEFPWVGTGTATVDLPAGVREPWQNPGSDAGDVLMRLMAETSTDSERETALSATGAESLSAAPAAGIAPAAPITGTAVRHASAYRAMQVHDCYLIVETPEGVTVIDQHALHERIVYEHLRNRVLAGAVESQRLLVPQSIEVTSKESALLLEQQTTFERAGLGLEDFGNGTLIVTSYPAMLRKVDLEELVRELLTRLEGGGTTGVESSARRDILDELLHMMSCKAAVKAGQRLSQEEIESLLVQLHLVNDSHHCPHGRPTTLSLSRMELDRQFGRLG